MPYTGSKAVAFMPQHSKVVKRLIEVGLIPAECVRFELVMEVSQVVRATCTFNVTEDQLAQIAKAYEDYPEEAAGMIREIVRPGAKLPEMGV